MWKKIVEVGPKTQAKFLKGIEVVDKMVGGTIGPAGRNRLIQQKYKAPWIINDGAEIARRIVLDDPVEDLAAQTLIEVAMKTAEQAGDGTSTSVVLASELIKEAMKRIDIGNEETSRVHSSNKVNPMQIWREIHSEKEKAIGILKKMALPVDDKQLDNIISTSLENHEYGKELADLIREIGKDGYVSVEDNWATKYGISTELTKGMRFLGSWSSVYLANSPNQKEALWEDTYVLVTNHKLESMEQIQNLTKEFAQKGLRKLVIIGGYSEGESPFSQAFIRDVSREVMLVSKGKDGLQYLAVKAPSLTSPELEDICAFTGATFIDKNLGIALPTVGLTSLGKAKKVSVTTDEVNIIDGVGEQKDLDKRVKALHEQIELEKDAMFKEKLKRRVASISSGVGIIRVGAQTETERAYLKEKLKDAVSSAKVSLEEGYVPGGGFSFQKVAKELGEDSILYKPLMSVNERIVYNAGGDLKIPKTIINPLKVDRLALENACSGAGMLITSDGAIAEERLTYGDYLEKALSKNLAAIDEKHDFRDDEVQDLGRGSVIN